MANLELAAPRFDFIFGAQVAVGTPQDLGMFNKGRRRVVPIDGGEFSGPDLRGKVIPGGADWQLIRADGVAELDARYTLHTEDGASIHVHNRALRHGPPEMMEALTAGHAVDPGDYYFRGAATFETNAERYVWLTRHVVVCTGHRLADWVLLQFYKVL